MTTITLMQELTTILAKFDADSLNGLINTIRPRRDNLAIAKETYKHIRKNAFEYYPNLFNAVGGKGWVELLRNGDDYIIERITKLEAMKVESRNAKIAAKLNKEGVVSVTGFESASKGADFEGRWTIQTDKGIRHVILTVVSAGGYNVQCHHYRILVKVINE